MNDVHALVIFQIFVYQVNAALYLLHRLVYLGGCSAALQLHNRKDSAILPEDSAVRDPAGVSSATSDAIQVQHVNVVGYSS